MPRLRRNSAHARWERIHFWIAAIRWDYFNVYSSDEERRDAYLQVEADLIAAYASECPGQRCRNFWCWTVGEQQPDGADEPKRLAELGLLTEEEIAYLAEQGDAWQPKRFDSKRWAVMMAGEA